MMKHVLLSLLMLLSIPVIGKAADYCEYFEWEDAPIIQQSLMTYSAEYCEYFEMEDTLGEYQCYVMLYDYNNEYCIDIEPLDPESSLYVMNVSYGHYTEEGGVCELVDTDRGCTMQLRRTSATTVILTQTMPFLEGKRFVKMTEAFPEWYTFSPADQFELLGKLDEYNKRYPKEYTLHNGHYASKENMMLGSEMEVKDDSLFTISYKEMVISCGTFSRDGNVMKLHDAQLGCDFYGLICDNRIKGVNFPVIEDPNLNYFPEAVASNDSGQSHSVGIVFVLLALLIIICALYAILCILKKRGRNAQKKWM